MNYKNNINARFGIEGNAISSYKEYAAQREHLLIKNENNFASIKRSHGRYAHDYNVQDFDFKYPYFKTPKISQSDVFEFVLSCLDDPNTPDANVIHEMMYNLFESRIPIVREYKYEFDKSKELFKDYLSDPAKKEENKNKIEDEIGRLIKRFTCADKKEIILNTKLTEIRAQLYKNLISPLRDPDTTPYPVSQPFYKVKEYYERSSLWNIFKDMPKMGLLHMHTSASVLPEWIIHTLLEDSDNNYQKYGKSYVVLGNNHKTRGKLTFTKPVNEPYAPISRRLFCEENGGSLMQEILELLSFRSDDINDIPYIWDEFNTIFSKTENLLDNKAFYRDYYTEAFKNLADDNIEYLELRSGFGKFKNFPDNEFLDELKLSERLANEYAKDKGKQFKLRVILCGNRGRDRRFDVIRKMVKAAKWANGDYKDLIIGFDVVSEEDRGEATKYYTEFIINSQIYKLLNFYFHDGETNWDFNTNMIDASLLSDRRVGHGFGLNIFPQLTDNLAFEQNTPLHKCCDDVDYTTYFKALDELIAQIGNQEHLSDTEKYHKISNGILKYLDENPLLNDIPYDKKTRGLALEICPISNQMLRYTPDLRLHPANALLHKGIQCVIANDDPQIFGNAGLTYDFISAFLAWDLDLWQIKQLIVNSIVYSAIPMKDNIESYYNNCITALNRFNVLWHRFLIEQIPDTDDIPDQAFSGNYRFLVPDDNYILKEDVVSVNEEYKSYLDQ